MNMAMSPFAVLFVFALLGLAVAAPHHTAEEEEEVDQGLVDALTLNKRLRDSNKGAADRSKAAMEESEAVLKELHTSFDDRTADIESYKTDSKPGREDKLKSMKDEYAKLFADCGSGKFIAQTFSSRDKLAGALGGFRAAAQLKQSSHDSSAQHLSHESHNNMVYQDRHAVQCPDKRSVMRMWKMQNVGGNRANFKTECIRGMEINPCVNLYTSWAMNGDGSVNSWKSLNIRCPAGSALQYWRMHRSGSGQQVRFNYQCCNIPNLGGISTHYTSRQNGGRDGWSNNLAYLDRHSVQCPTDHAMTSWQVVSLLQETPSLEVRDTEAKEAETENTHTAALTSESADTWSGTEGSEGWGSRRRRSPAARGYHFVGGCSEESSEGWSDHERWECFGMGMSCHSHSNYRREGNNCVHRPPPPPQRFRIRYGCASLQNTAAGGFLLQTGNRSSINGTSEVEWDRSEDAEEVAQYHEEDSDAKDSDAKEEEEMNDGKEMNHEEEHDQEDAVFREADEAEKDTDEQMNDEEMNGEDNDEEEQDKYEVHEADQAENSSSPSEEAADEPFIPEFHKIAQKLFNSDQDTVENAPTQPATHIVADAPKRAEMLPPGHQSYQSFRIKAAHGGRSAGRRGLRGSSNEEPEMKIGAVQGRDDASLRSARRDLEKEAASGVLPDKADVLAQNALMQSELDAALFNAQQAENKVTQLKAELDRSKLGRQVVSNHIGNIGQTYDAQMAHLEKEITTLKHMCEESKALKEAEQAFGKITTEVNKHRFNR